MIAQVNFYNDDGYCVAHGADRVQVTCPDGFNARIVAWGVDVNGHLLGGATLAVLGMDGDFLEVKGYLVQWDTLKDCLTFEGQVKK